MNTTKFDNLVFASQRAAQDQLQTAHLNIQGGQPGGTAAVQNASAPPGQAVTTPVAGASQPQGAVYAQAAQPAASGEQKKKAPKRKKDDNQPKRPRGRPRKYPLPEGFLTNGMAAQQASRPAAAPFVNGARPLGVPVTRPSAALSNGFRPSLGPQQNGISQPGMSLYEAWSRNQGAAFLGSPSKQAPLYLQRSHQQQQAQQQQQQVPQEHYDINALVPNGFLALMQEYAQTELAGNAQDCSLAVHGLPAVPPLQAQPAATATSTQPPAAITNPQAPLPIFSQADAGMPPVPPPVPQLMVPGLTTRSPSRRKPQKSPLKPQQQLPLLGPASPTRMQQALGAKAPISSPTRQGVPGGSPARSAASPTGRSRAQRKNAATPQRVVPGAAATAASPTQAAAAAAPGASAGPQQAAAAAAAPASAAPQGPQQAASQQPQAAGAGNTGSPGHSRPPDFDLDDDDPGPYGEESQVDSMNYPGLRPSKRMRKTKLLTELAKSEQEQPEQGVHNLPPWHISESRKQKCKEAGQNRDGVEAAAQASGRAVPTKAAQPQVTGPTEISKAATVSDNAHPAPKRRPTAKRPAEGGKALARKNAKAAADKQARSEAAPSPGMRRHAAAARASQSEPNAAAQLPAASSADLAAVQALLQATASPVLQRAEISAVASPSTAATSAPPQQATAPQQQHAQAAVAGSTEGAATDVASAAAQPAEAAAATAAAVRQPVDELASLLASRSPNAATDQARSKLGDAAGGRQAAQGAPPETAVASRQPVAKASQSAAAAVSAAQAPPAAAQQSTQEPTSAAGVAPAPASSAPERQQSPSGTGRSQQNSAGVGALKEELNNVMISCLAEEAKRAHAAQEAIEGCRAAEEGLEHLNKQYVMQENFSTSYEEVVDEVSNALQATSAANRQVQEVQERLNAVQEELKLVVANAELARSHAMTVLRKQAQLKEEMEVAREEVSRILHQPQTDLDQLRDTVNAQKEHVSNMRAAREAAVESLVQCRADKDQLLSLMKAEPPPSLKALAAAGFRLASAQL